MECIDILGVKISKIDYESAIEVVEGFLIDGEKHQIVTPNPEFIVLAQKDLDFRQILNQADLAIPDGVGLRMAAKFLSLPAVNSTVVKIPQLLLQGLFVGAAAIFKTSFLDVLPETATGTDLMVGLCELAAKKDYSIFLLGSRGGVAEEAAEHLKERFANLNIVGTCEGDPQTVPPAFRPAPSSTRDGVNSIDFLFVAYGHPAQEKWMVRNLPKIPVKVAMGVGGAFDFIAGKKRRAPEILRRLGLEWLWRLIQEPSRWRRILNATIKFPLLVFFHKLSRDPANHSN